jgi:small-conductance mechanosensitive channel
MLKAFAATAQAEEVASGTILEISKWIELLFTKIPLWIAGGLVIILTLLVARIAREVAENKLAERGIEEEHKEIQVLGGRITYTVVLTLGITIGLKIAGIDLTTIIAAVGFGVGFALKDLIMNFIAGVMILVGRHFAIGDFINVGGTIGKVVEIQSRVTVLQAIDGTKVIVPNADMFSKQITSFTSNPFRRIEVIINIDFRNNLENALKICMHVLKTTKGILLQPAPAVLIDDFGDNGPFIKLRGWVDSKGGWLKIRSELMKNLKSEFDKYGIVIPWPIWVDAESVKVNETEFIEQKTQVKKSTVPFMVPSPQMTQMPQVQEVSIEDEQPLKPLGEK